MLVSKSISVQYQTAYIPVLEIHIGQYKCSPECIVQGDSIFNASSWLSDNSTVHFDKHFRVLDTVSGKGRDQLTMLLHTMVKRVLETLASTKHGPMISH